MTFTAKDEKVAAAGVSVLFDGGLFGSATSDGKELKVEVLAAKKGDKADVVVVKDVHVCCGQCQNGIKATFKDAKITFTDPSGLRATDRHHHGPRPRTGRRAELPGKAGFNGSLDK